MSNRPEKHFSNRPEKKAIHTEVRTRMEGSGYVLLTDCRGMKVAGMTELRSKLRSTKSRLLVVPNSFLSLASRDLGWSGVEQFLNGPTAMITGTGDVSAVAKVLQEFAKTTNMPAVKGGWFARQALSASDVEAIASIPPREVLLGQVVGTIAAPMSRLVGVLQQKVASVLYVLKAVEEKKAKSGA